MIRRLVVGLILIGVLLAGLVFAAGSGWLGSRWGAGEVTRTRVPAAVVEARAGRQESASRERGKEKESERLERGPGAKQILFGDLHVHSTFSTDAFMMALPATGGDGARPVADACDFARFCSDLDFWSINDHALALTPLNWRQTVESIRQCNEVAGDPTNPDLVAFLGWEWTQFGTTPDNHYGHKNVVLRDLDDDSIPTRPIAALAPQDAWDRRTDRVPGPFAMGLLPLLLPNSSSLDFIRYIRDMLGVEQCPDGVPVRELPTDCREATVTPAGLFAKLDDWGFESMVIPHGTTWGFYTPHGSAWDKQLDGDMHDPKRQTLIEVFSGHGNSEEFRPWKSIERVPDGRRLCPEATDEYLPSCRQAGEIIRGRCLEAGESEDECEKRAEEARRDYLDGDVFGHLTVPGAKAEEWLDSGQCRDCFQPSFNYRPKSSVQYIMGLRDPKREEGSRRFNFGFIASSDNHTARPGTGYKEYSRTQMTEARLAGAGSQMFGAISPPPLAPEPRSRAIDPTSETRTFFAAREAERASSFFLTGGLAAVHSEGRSREEIWDAMQRREVYGTSGPRILLWFDLLPGKEPGPSVPMGGQAERNRAPKFRVRALGSFEQKPGCPPHSGGALSPDRVEHLCDGECYNPSDKRRRITRIEIVRIAPQQDRRENIANLIDDAWKVIPCSPDESGCTVEVEDPEFLHYQRDIMYYVRAIEEPSMAVNANGARCKYDDNGRCLEVDLCSDQSPGDDCLAETEERAWSSPIMVYYVEPAPEFAAEPDPAQVEVETP